MTVSQTITCSVCGQSRESKPRKDGEAKLPTGWKAGPTCGKCWRGRYVMRAVTVPIAEVVTDREAFKSALYAGWEASTAAANLAVQTLFRADVMRTPAMEKMPPMPRVYLYGELRPITEMESGSLVALLHSVEAKYRESRWEVIWQRTAAPMCFRYPYPYPFGAKCFTLSATDGGALHCEFRLGGQRHTVRLAQGSQHRRQAALIRSIIAGGAKPVEMTLLQAKNKAWMIKVAAWLPRPSREERHTETMRVHTGDGRFLTAIIGQREPWLLNADHVARWIAEHDRYRQRMSEDLKHEKRWPAQSRRRINGVVANHCGRQNDRLKNWIGQASKMLVEYAVRNRVGLIMYDDTDQSFAIRFPWFQLRTAIAYKCDDRGIRFERLSAGEKAGTARNETKTNDD